jgi:hypothetical protein
MRFSLSRPDNHSHPLKLTSFKTEQRIRPMTTFFRSTVLALMASVGLVSFGVATSVASQPNALLLSPQNDCYVPKFGFSSFNIAGFGERVTYVRWGGLAAQFGLEPGDTILSLNGFPLTYHGSWSDALHRAMHRGGVVRLRIRDVRTGAIAHRQMYVGDGVGPITPKYHTAGTVGPTTHYGHHHDHDHNFDYPYGPITQKSKVGPGHNHGANLKLKQISKLFED